MVRGSVEAQCSPTDPRTLLFAYSTDLDSTIVENGFNNILYFTSIQNLFRTYANIRFDTRNEEQIAYHYDFQSFNTSILSHKPDPSLGYQDSTTGSDVLKVITNFLETSPSLCGSSIFIVAKRYPNDEPQLEGLISELRNNHIFVYIIADSSLNGGTNSAALFDISSKTNGFCIFGNNPSGDMWISTLAFIQKPYQVASKNVRVTGSGSQSLSVTVYEPGTWPTQQLSMIITFLGHPLDGSVKSLNYKLIDPNGEVNISGPFQPVTDQSSTYCYEFPVVNNTIEYTLTVNYEYENDREGYLEMRFYNAQCSPTDPRTLLFAYSTDLDYDIVENGFDMMLYFTSIQKLWRTYANIRFDTRNEEQIAYHYDFPSFNASILAHKPDPSLGYQNSTTGSDVLKVIKKFLQTCPSLCGSSIFIVAKRYPNDAPQLEGLISELQNNHIFVYIVADSEPSGGTNPSAMFEISSKTNGFCIFGPNNYAYYEIYLSSIAFITRPYQVASKNVRVTGSGSQTLSVMVSQTQQLRMIVTSLGHPRDGSIKSLNYTLTDPNGEVNTSGPSRSVLARDDTLCWEFPTVNNTIEYTLTVNYEYEKDREGYLEMRFYSYFKIGYWLPFDN